MLNKKEKKFYHNKKILIAGGTGLVGSQVLKFLKDIKCKIISASLDDNKKNFKNIKFVKSDLRYLNNCEKLTKNIDVVINFRLLEQCSTVG